VPVACSTSALTGQDGSLYYTPSATKFCLLDFTDFPAGTSITVPAQHDFRVGDPVVFEEEGGSIDTALTAGTQYYVVAKADTSIDVSATKGGTAITLNGDGGTGTDDTAGGHIGIKYDPFGAVCQIQSWDLSIERESLDVTTLKCGVGGSATAGKYAAFRKTQPGYASGSGTITVIFTDNDDALGQRMLDNVMLSSQEGARVRLFVNTVSDGQATPAPDLTNSMYIEADVSLESMSLSVNPDDPITAEIGYTISNVAHLFKTQIA
jgi:hypothetical protein